MKNYTTLFEILALLHTQSLIQPNSFELEQQLKKKSEKFCLRTIMFSQNLCSKDWLWALSQGPSI